MEFTTTFNEVITIAIIMRAIKIPDEESPLVLNVYIKALNDPVTNVTKQNIMSKI
jgi:hypothetical protein